MLVAGVQLSVSTEDRTQNLEKAETHIRAAASAGAKVICLQEYFNTGFFTAGRDPANFELAETTDGPTIQYMSTLAQDLRIRLIVPFFEQDRLVKARYFNSAAIINDRGEVDGLYRKLYPTISAHASERFYFSPGNLGCPVFQAGDLVFGVLICHDRHFFEVPRVMALQGADVLFVPTSTRRAPGRFNVWKSELVSMAANNNSYVVGVNSTGSNDGRDQFGHSMIVDPLGIVTASLEEEEGYVIADISSKDIHTARITYFLFRDFRADIIEELLDLY